MFKPLLVIASLLAAVAPAQALTTGDLAFTSFNADEDGWSMVTFVDIAAGSTVYFTDNEWGGSAFNTGESYFQWVTGGSTIAAGTVIRFTTIDAASRGASVGGFTQATVSGSSNTGFNQSEDSLYAYVAATVTSVPTFLAAITTTAFAGATTSGLLTGTSLSIGAGAVALGGGAEYDEYVGPRSGLTSFADYKPLVSNIANWTNNPVDGAYSALVPNTTAFTVSAVPEPGSYAMLLAGLAAVGFVARRRR